MKFTGVKDSVVIEKVQEIHKEALAMIKEKPSLKYAGRKMYRYKPAEVLNGTEFLDNLEIELSNRLATAAGKARLSPDRKTMKISLHYRLLKDNDKELRGTYLHELAHILAGCWYGYCCGHDDNWKQVAVMLGDDGGRCHTMDVSSYRPKRKVKTYLYKCECQGHMLSQRRHNRCVKSEEYYGRTFLSCKKCNKNIQYTGQVLCQ